MYGILWSACTRMLLILILMSLMILIIQILHLCMEILIQPVHRNLLWNKKKSMKERKATRWTYSARKQTFQTKKQDTWNTMYQSKDKHVKKCKWNWKQSGNQKANLHVAKQEKDNHIRKRNKDSLTCKVSITKLRPKQKKTYKESTMRGWQKGGKRLSEEENKRSTMKYLFVVVSIHEPKETQMVERWS
jgi:hypothetical protein